MLANPQPQHKIGSPRSVQQGEAMTPLWGRDGGRNIVPARSFYHQSQGGLFGSVEAGVRHCASSGQILRPTYGLTFRGWER